MIILIFILVDLHVASVFNEELSSYLKLVYKLSYVLYILINEYNYTIVIINLKYIQF